MSSVLFHMIAGAPEPVAPFSHATEVDGWCSTLRSLGGQDG
jgi:2-iminobutanoate/2-iminopropanoate deaminase